MGGLVLVVGDASENRALARATLEEEGYEVAFATNGKDAVAAVETTRPDCVVMDIRMPEVDGVTAAERIRDLPAGKHLAIIFVTALRDATMFDRALAAGGDDFILKPYRPDELVVRIQTAMRLRKLELQKAQLVTFLDHDFKHPFNVIDLQVQSLARNADKAERVRTGASRIKDETRSLCRLISNMLDVSKRDDGRFIPARKSVGAEELMRDAVGEMSTLARAAGLELVANASGTNIFVDPDLMRRVIANLIENAIRRAPEGTRILISIERGSHSVEIAVADQGYVSSDQRDTDGGLGLAFCKLAVEAHGGKLWVEDGDPGAVFRIKVPC